MFNLAIIYLLNYGHITAIREDLDNFFCILAYIT